MQISLIIPTFNPNSERFFATLSAVGTQTLGSDLWECIIVDNASSPPLKESDCEEWCGRSLKVIVETKQGLSHARLAGIREARANLLVFCDDDNVLANNYLERAVELMAETPAVGVAGGKNIPKYLDELPEWFADGNYPLGCRDLGESELVASSDSFVKSRRYPECSPVGAGMVFRREAVESWARTVGVSGVSDRKGNSLSSAGDCDMVLHALGGGFDAAYWPGLVLEHLIPKERLRQCYLGDVSRAAYRDFVRVLDIHGIRPWSAISRCSLPFRIAKAWYVSRAWRGPNEWIRWKGIMGQYEGRASLHCIRS